MLPDYLAAGPLLIERIRAALPALRAVLPAGGLARIFAEALPYSPADLAGIGEAAIQSPSVFVLYDGDRLGDSAGRGQAGIVHQRWMIVLAVRNARQGDGGAALLVDAGPLLAALLAALMGFQLSADHRPLVRVAAPAPGYSPALAYYPLAFETAISTLGD